MSGHLERSMESCVDIEDGSVELASAPGFTASRRPTGHTVWIVFGKV